MTGLLHVAIIMDGNGRWATAQGLPREAGHREGARALRRTIEAAAGQGVGVLTAYAFSSDNWRRPTAEVAWLMRLFRHYFRSERRAALDRGIRVSVIGRRDRIPVSLRREIEATERATRFGRRLWVRIAVDYSSRDAIVQAAQLLAARAAGAAHAASGPKAGRRAPSFPAPPAREEFERLLHTPDWDRAEAEGPGEPDASGAPGASETPAPVDLLIRTGGEQRLSDFLLWECAYAELYFTDTMWPVFGADDLARAVAAFRQRERRFGGLVA